MRTIFVIKKIIRNILKEEIMSSNKFYIHGSPTTNFPYEENKEEEDLEAQSEVLKMATSMGLEPSKGYIATTYINEKKQK